MKTKNKDQKKQPFKSVAAFLVLALSPLLMSCGGGDDKANSSPTPTLSSAPAPAPVTAPAPVPPSAPVIGNFIEDPSSGAPIGGDPNSWNALSQRFRTNVTFYGTATVSSVNAQDYFIENPGTSAVKFTKSNQQALTNQSPTLQIQASGDAIFIQSPFGRAQSFYFQPQVSLYGLVLNSTETIGLYMSNDGSSLLKVLYNVKYPAIQQYEIENYGGFWNSLQVRITQKIINTSGTYVPPAAR